MIVVFCPECRQTVRLATRVADCPQCGYQPPARLRHEIGRRQRRSHIWTGLGKALLMLGFLMLPLRLVSPRALKFTVLFLLAGTLCLVIGHFGLWRLLDAIKRKTHS